MTNDSITTMNGEGTRLGRILAETFVHQQDGFVIDPSLEKPLPVSAKLDLSDTETFLTALPTLLQEAFARADQLLNQNEQDTSVDEINKQ